MATATTASPPEIRSARFESTSMRTTSPAYAKPAARPSNRKTNRFNFMAPHEYFKLRGLLPEICDVRTRSIRTDWTTMHYIALTVLGRSARFIDWQLFENLHYRACEDACASRVRGTML